MKRITLTLIIISMFAIVGFFFFRTFNSSLKPVVLSGAAMGELIGGSCQVGDNSPNIESCTYSRGRIVRDGSTDLSSLDCARKKKQGPCPDGSKTRRIGRVTLVNQTNFSYIH